jgi:hypothetical protein
MLEKDDHRRVAPHLFHRHSGALRNLQTLEGIVDFNALCYSMYVKSIALKLREVISFEYKIDNMSSRVAGHIYMCV